MTNITRNPLKGFSEHGAKAIQMILQSSAAPDPVEQACRIASRRAELATKKDKQATKTEPAQSQPVAAAVVDEGDWPWMPKPDSKPAVAAPHALDPIERLTKRGAEAQRRIEKREATTPQQLFLPGMEELLRAMPNSVARSSLFAPIARGKRKFHRQTTMVTRADVEMTYTGEQLDEADADLTLQLIFAAQPHPLGLPVTFVRGPFLEAMGRRKGGTQYEWLHRRMKALTEGTLFIEVKKPDGSPKYRIGTMKAFHILSGFDYDEPTETYTFTLDPRWRILFSNREYALLDWEKRLQIGRGQDLAKAIQRLIAASSDEVQRHNLGWLKEKMQYEGRMRDFKDALAKAVAELERLGIIATGRIEESTKGKEQLVVLLAKN